MNQIINFTYEKNEIYNFKLFFALKKMSNNYGPNLCCLFLKIFGPLGFQNCRIYAYLFKNFFISKNKSINNLVNLFSILLSGICSGWFIRFNLIGYNYKLKASYSHSFPTIFSGFFYSLVFEFPKSIRIFQRKRSFMIFSSNLIEFNFVVEYLRHLRDLYPYKIRGLVLKKESIRMKQGKKVKFR